MTHLTRFLFCSALALLSTPAIASSEPVTVVNEVPAVTAPAEKFTDAALRQFYNDSKQAHLKSFEEYKSFMSTHAREDVQFALTMVNHLPNQPDQKQTLVMDKKKFEESLEENYAMSQGADIKHKIIDVYIGADGKSATVRDMTTMSKVVDMPRDGKVFKIEVQSQSTCDDVLTLGDKGQPQIHQSTCTAENYFYPQK